MEFEIDDSSNGDTTRNVTTWEVSSSIADKDKVYCSCFDPTEEHDQDDNMTQDSSRVDQILLAIPALSTVKTVDEPYMGQEFVSEAVTST